MNKLFPKLTTSLLLVAGLTLFFRAEAAIKLPALIGNNMVLQQKVTINVWGWADAGEKVTIQASWLTEPSTTITKPDGTWKTTITTPSAGGPYKMTLSGRDYSVTIENVMIGEVWVCSGQSNMEFTMRGLGGWANYKPEVKAEVADGNYKNVHLFTVQRDTSAFPLSNCKGNWILPDTNTINDFSATAWFFGSYLSQKLNVPVGLIVAAWGGTPAEVWTPAESIKAEPDLGFYLSHFNGSQWWPGTIGVLYNAMIHPLINYSIKGAIWYQGESNASDARYYPTLMNTLITSWRKNWGESDFPFYFVQIAPFSYDEAYSGVLLREAQLKCLSTPNTGMAVTMDIAGDVTDIHPKNKLDVGKRLAFWALNKTYGKNEESFSGPIYTRMKTNGNSIILEFTNTDGGLKIVKSDVNNFSIAGADHVFYPAIITIEGNTLIASSPKTKHPQAVRYAFTNTSVATLINGAGLPASSFRTDNWDVITEKAVLKAFLDPQTKKMSYLLSTKAREADIYYAFGKSPDKNSTRFLNPIPADNSGTLFATVSRNGYLAGTNQNWKIITHQAIGATVNYKEKFSTRFQAGGELALVDGIIATTDFQDGSWQGFEKNNLDIVLDLGKFTFAKSISCNFLSDNHSWIFLPKKVTIQVSEDGFTYKPIGEKEFSDETEVKGACIQTVAFPCKTTVRFVKITAINQGKCPSWHPGAGNDAWLFADEIMVK